tara:strand:+ start:844 stop:1200 length:357 start_codon:yes stop_codon:yes gene_type:complete
MTSGQEQYAVVKWYDTKLRYGFVTILETKEDIFVHYNAIRSNSQRKRLWAGEYITVVISESEKGQQCEEVFGIQGGLLLFESNRKIMEIDYNRVQPIFVQQPLQNCDRRQTNVQPVSQ